MVQNGDKERKEKVTWRCGPHMSATAKKGKVEVVDDTQAPRVSEKKGEDEDARVSWAEWAACTLERSGPS